MPKIVRLTENDLVRIVKKIISEKMAPPAPTASVNIKTATSSGGGNKKNLKDVLNLKNKFYFKTGKTGIDSNSISNFQDFTNFMAKTKNYLTKLNKPFGIGWTASESQTPKTGTNVNELSQKRGQSISDYVSEYFKTVPSYPEDMMIPGRYQQGLEKYTPGENVNDKKFLNDQWVELNIWID
jgi:hypothetical protein